MFTNNVWLVYLFTFMHSVSVLSTLREASAAFKLDGTTGSCKRLLRRSKREREPPEAASFFLPFSLSLLVCWSVGLLVS